MKIKIEKNTMNESLVIIMNEKKNVVMLNGQPVNYSIKRFIFKVFNMSSGWPNKLEDNDVLDGTSYSIIIKDKNETGEEITEYSFKNKFPEDIFRLDMLINDVSNSVMKENE